MKPTLYAPLFSTPAIPPCDINKCLLSPCKAWRPFSPPPDPPSRYLRISPPPYSFAVRCPVPFPDTTHPRSSLLQLALRRAHLAHPVIPWPLPYSAHLVCPSIIFQKLSRVSLRCTPSQGPTQPPPPAHNNTFRKAPHPLCLSSQQIMDGLLGSEFAVVLRDSLNSTPRRHVMASPPPAMSSPLPSPVPSESPPKKPRGSEFGIPCNMQLEPRLQFAPIPTSPTSPLPTSAKLVDCPSTASSAAHPKIETQLPSSRHAIFNAPHQSSLVQRSPICKPNILNSSDRFASAKKHLAASFDTAAGGARPLDVLATVSVEQGIKPNLRFTADARPRTTMVVSNLPTSPINSEPLTPLRPDEKKKPKSRTSGKPNPTGRVFSCKQCPSTFSQQFNLNKHVRAVHERRRPFECETCHARFQQKSHRTMHHLAVHEKLRQFACDHCNASFSWRGVLKKHRKSIHGLDE